LTRSSGGSTHGLCKIGVACGRAAWRDFARDLVVARIGRVTEHLDPFVGVSNRIILEGSKVIRIVARGREALAHQEEERA
jgi:hypothetical protein